MSVRDLIPWGRNTQVPSTYRDSEREPFLALHREMNRLFDDVFRSFGTRWSTLKPWWSEGWPNVEVSETDKEIRVTAELPGLEEKDIEVLLDDSGLTLRGEKQSETDDKVKQFSERYYGRFERRIPLYQEVEQNRVDARFKNGVLTVTLLKTAKAQSQTKRIAINNS